MSLGFLAGGRRLAESLMVDTCTIARAGTGPKVRNPETGAEEPPPPTTVYAGRCKVQLTDSLDVTSADFGGQSVDLTRVEVHVPVTDVAFLPEDTVTIDTAAHDPQLADRTFRVKGSPAKSFATARRLECEEIV